MKRDPKFTRTRRNRRCPAVYSLSPGAHAAANLLDPRLGDVLDILFPLHHKGQRPDRMALVVGAMTGGFTAAQVI
jgi:hypothetical protein